MDPRALHSSPRFKTYTLGVDDIDLVAAGGSACRAITVNQDCTLVLTPDELLPSQTTDATPLYAKAERALSAKKIGGTGAGSTPSGTVITVEW